ncbi:SirB2 family protein [Burkholderiaceae bacterium DAT-1]|nr:SirB2 family protein [Burkholderiaceae bacterium DAT-1]
MVVEYLAVLHFHRACAGISISLFLLRVVLTLSGIQWRTSRLLRFAPHLVDSMLLGAAIYLACTSHQYPFQSDWLTAKLCALLLYILLGKQALKAEQSRSRAMLFSLGALMSVAYIVSVALTRSPIPLAFATR